MSDAPARPQRHFFTIDLEEYFQVVAFAGVIPRDDWTRWPARAEAQTDSLLAVLADHGALATFFTVGWLAERMPELVRRIVDAGHEVACHSWWHQPIGALTPEEFRHDVRRTRHLLEDLTGCRVYGYRAPSFSLVPGREWAFDVLIEEGYAYDSSVFPIRRPDYGYPGAPATPYAVRRPSGVLWELPMTTLPVGPARIPAAGGGYLRHLPFAVTRHAFHRSDRRGEPGMFYVHPWEIDPDQPRVEVPWLTRRRHYGGLDRMLPRIRRLLEDFTFTSVADYYGFDPRTAEEPHWPMAGAA